MNTNKSFGILVLAAGQSRRFGSDKLMAKMPDRRPVIAHSLAPTLEFSTIHNLELCVITRADNKPLIDYLIAEKINYLIAEDAHLGMGHSIAHGVKNNSDWHGWMIALADMPNITLDLLNSLWNKIQENKRDIVRPLCIIDEQKVPAHPVYFPARFCDSLQSLTGDKGAKELIINQIFVTSTNGEFIEENTIIDVDTIDILQTLYKQKERTI
jgi:molybdenum cofactor cytidylyltransferase